MVEAVGAGDFTGEDGTALASAASSSCTSSFFLIGVTEDQDLAIAERPEEFAVQVTKKLFGELCIPCDVRDEVLLIQRRRKIHHQDLLRGSTLLKDQRVGAA
jgi:hypothetical protein